jgi:hypothetical protein
MRTPRIVAFVLLTLLLATGCGFKIPIPHL